MLRHLDSIFCFCSPRGLAILATFGLLSGCTGPLEDITKQTRQEVKRSNDTLDELKRLEKIRGALELSSRDANSPNLHLAGTEELFRTATVSPSENGSFYKFLAAAAPLRFGTFSPQAGLTVRNVTVIQKKSGAPSGPKKGPSAESSVKPPAMTAVYAPTNPEYYRILKNAALQLLRDLELKSTLPLDESQRDELLTEAVRALLIVPTVLGAGEEGDGLRHDRSSQDSFQESERTRQDVANRLHALHGSLPGLGDRYPKAELDAAISSKLGVR